MCSSGAGRNSRKGYAPLKLFVQTSHQKDVLPYFQRFLEVRRESAPSILSQLAITKTLLRRRLATLLLGIVLIFAALAILSACGEGPDTSGLNTANQKNLTSVSANGTPMTQKDLDTAKSKEPFAYNLALLRDSVERRTRAIPSP